MLCAQRRHVTRGQRSCRCRHTRPATPWRTDPGNGVPGQLAGDRCPTPGFGGRLVLTV